PGLGPTIQLGEQTLITVDAKGGFWGPVFGFFGFLGSIPHPVPILGPGLGPTIQLGEQTLITVDAKAAGKGKVTCSVCTPDGSEVDVDVVENPDGTFDIFYTAPQPGKYVICVRFGGEHIPNSPFQVMVSEKRGKNRKKREKIQGKMGKKWEKKRVK
ncbi:filamin-A-like, partial [Malurus melanocephalus]|uniref:filamin-A-like n=1 Tax=Malurus melanocephalus TaxID=175006 RepID=UPI0025486CDC